MTINVMTLGGLAVALGVVIDDAIVDIENIVRRLREAGDALARARRAIIERASVEVVYATFVLALTMLPVILLTGLQGAFSRRWGWPFAGHDGLAAGGADGHARLLAAAAGRIGTCGRACAAGPLQGSPSAAGGADLRPSGARGLGGGADRAGGAGRFCQPWQRVAARFRERHYVLGIKGPPGASFDWMRATGMRISQRLLAIPEVLSAEEQIGRAEAGEDTWPPARANSTSG
jgi:hypothetical protein